VVEGDHVEAMQVRIEGSPELLAYVAETLTPEERERWMPNPPDGAIAKVFLGYGSEDQAISDRIAHALHAAGVEVVFYAPWDLKPGDSIPGRISSGLEACSHFVTLWTPQSRQKPWVLQEMHSAFMLHMRGAARFTIVRYEMGADTIPAIAGDRLSPELRADHFEEDLAQFVRDVQGVSRRPAPASTPPVLPRDERYSPAALAVARALVEESATGRWSDPMFDVDELRARTELSATDIEDATHELGALVRDLRFGRYTPEDELFAEFDQRWREWDPGADALRIAADLVNAGEESVATEMLMERYGWPVRRLNPALTYLIMRRVVQSIGAANSALVSLAVITTPATRRFVKSRSD
jgi:hypothetical protein